MATGDQQDMATRLYALLPAGWFPDLADAPVLNAILQGIGAGMAAIYGLLAFVKAQTRLGTAQGGFIDLTAADYFGTNGLPRLLNETDAAYAARVEWNLTAARGTLPGLVAMIESITGRTPKVLYPANAGMTGGYATPGNATAGGGLLAYAGNATDIRATSATFVGSNGLVQTAGPNVLRIDYSTGVGVPLIEAAATNWVDGSYNGFTEQYGCVLTPNAAMAPDGTMTATSATSASGGIMNGPSTSTDAIPLPSTVCCSCWVKASTATVISGASGLVSNGGGNTLTSFNVTTSWSRVFVTGEVSGGNIIQMQFQLQPGITYYFWGAQIEESSVPSSLIETSTGPATRAADTYYTAGSAGAGAYGSTELPYQMFITVYRPQGGALASLGGYATPGNPAAGGGLGGYGSGAIAYVNPSMIPAQITDSFIYQQIAEWVQGGSLAWVYITN